MVTANACRAQEDMMTALWWTLGIVGLVLYTLYIVGAFGPHKPNR